MTLIQTIRFCKIADDELIYLKDGIHTPFIVKVADLRKYTDMSVEVIHAEQFYPFYTSPPDKEWLLTIRVRNYKQFYKRRLW